MNLTQPQNARFSVLAILAVTVLTAMLLIGCGGSASSGASCTTTGVTTTPQITSLADPSHSINIANPSDGQVPAANFLPLPCVASSLPTMYVTTTGGQCPFKFTMTQSILSGPSGATTFSGLSLNSSTGAVTWKPNPNNCALGETGTVTFSVSDANGKTASPAMTVPVQLVY